MKEAPDMKAAFNGTASPPPTPFKDYLRKYFDAATEKAVAQAFKNMGLPLPKDSNEFMKGTEGALVFLNPYGVVIRIEKKKTSCDLWQRFDDNPLILQPLASLEAGQAVIEVCPGVAFTPEKEKSFYLYCQLRSEGIDFWDEGAQNVGLVPLALPQFPGGIPIVVDRLAVGSLPPNLPPSPSSVTLSSQEDLAAAQEAEEALYGPLRDAFAEGLKTPAKMKGFWQMCADYVAKGKMIAGWNDERVYDFEDAKPEIAGQKAEQYNARLAKSGRRGPQP